MIKHLKYNEIDKVQWDACINRSFNGNIYALSWYLDIVCYGWEALIEDDYETVFPLTNGKKGGIDYLFQPNFSQQLGIFSVKRMDAETVVRFINNIPGHYRLIEINLNRHNKLPDNFDSYKNNINTELPLIQDYTGLWSAYSENTRRNIKKARNQGLQLTRHSGPEALIRLFRENRGREIKQWSDRQYKMLSNLLHTCIHKQTGEVYSVHNAHNELCASAFFARSHGRIIFLFSGLSKDGKESGAMPFLIDAVINQHAASNLILDFEGSNDEGLARFYASFGAEQVQYPAIRINNLPFLIQWVHRIKRFL
ncbi:MAG: GNAT family N-acetyltransferase [Bacteroidales bacterium]|nr:GNAT family N-acetyltransferase [Bacteroidales bacterium]